MNRMRAMSTFALVMLVCMTAVGPVLAHSEGSLVQPLGLIETQFIGADQAWSHNITGSGIIVSVVSSGADKGSLTDLHPQLIGRIASLIDYTETNNSDGIAEDSYMFIGTFSAGMVAGLGTNGSDPGRGTAPGAKIVVQRIVGDGGSIVIPAYSTLFSDAIAGGSTIFKWDVGYNDKGNYTDPSSQFDMATRDADSGTAGDQPLFCVISTGNYGPNPTTVGQPGSAKDVLTVGTQGNPRHGTEKGIMSFSSRGPTRDGRIKPDVVAPGDGVYGLDSRLDGGKLYTNFSGGVAPTGLGAGAAALISQYYKDKFGITPSPALLKAALINGALEVPDGNPIPNMNEGWGMISLKNVIYPTPFDTILFNQNVTLVTGQKREFYARPAVTTAPLKITLVWTDPEAPNTTGTGRTLMNDLELKVTAPDGKVYVGNQFSGGWSVPNPPGNDSANNVENVHIQSPVTNSYKINVAAKWVGKDARKDTGPIDQDFALVISNGAFSGAPDIQPPVAKAPAPQNVAVGATVNLDGSASTDNVGIINYTWTFNDGGIKTLYGKTASYKFNNVGNFQVTLKVWDGAGNSDTDSTWVNVTSVSNPLARVEVSPLTYSLKVGEMKTFTATAYDTGNNQISALISWGVIGSIGTIAQNGTLTATTVGSGQVSATATAGGVTKYGYANVTVLSKPPPGMGTVSGAVLDMNSNPISGAKVTLLFASNQTVANTTTTSAAGTYSITRGPGSYSIYAEKSGYTTSQKKQVTITVGDVTSTSIVLTPGGIVNPGTLSGKVVDPSGNTLPGATVSLLFSSNHTFVNKTTTNSAGSYSMKCASGSYLVYAEMSGFDRSDEQTVTIAAGGQTSQNLMVKTSQTTAGGIDVMLLSLIVIIIVVVIVVLLLFIFSRRRKKEEPAKKEIATYQPTVPISKTLEKVTLVHDETCNDCQEVIKASSDAVKCKCGKHYHLQCASSITLCPKCGTDLTPALPKERPASPPPPPPPPPSAPVPPPRPPQPQPQQMATPPPQVQPARAQPPPPQQQMAPPPQQGQPVRTQPQPPRPQLQMAPPPHQPSQSQQQMAPPPPQQAQPARAQSPSPQPQMAPPPQQAQPVRAQQPPPPQQQMAPPPPQQAQPPQQQRAPYPPQAGQAYPPAQPPQQQRTPYPQPARPAYAPMPSQPQQQRPMTAQPPQQVPYGQQGQAVAPRPQSVGQPQGAQPQKKVIEDQFVRDLGIARPQKKTIEDLFLLYRDGRLIKHKTTELKPMDADILASMLIAVQEFVKDAFKSGSMNEMGYDGKRIYFTQGTYLTLAVVADSNIPLPGINDKMKSLLVEIEREYGTHLISWNGNVGALKFTEEYLVKFIADITSP